MLNCCVLWISLNFKSSSTCEAASFFPRYWKGKRSWFSASSMVWAVSEASGFKNLYHSVGNSCRRLKNRVRLFCAANDGAIEAMLPWSAGPGRVAPCLAGAESIGPSKSTRQDSI